jgi:hypothetical protein
MFSRISNISTMFSLKNNKTIDTFTNMVFSYIPQMNAVTSIAELDNEPSNLPIVTINPAPRFAMPSILPSCVRKTIQMLILNNLLGTASANTVVPGSMPGNSICDEPTRLWKLMTCTEAYVLDIHNQVVAQFYLGAGTLNSSANGDAVPFISEYVAATPDKLIKMINVLMQKMPDFIDPTTLCDATIPDISNDYNVRFTAVGNHINGNACALLGTALEHLKSESFVAYYMNEQKNLGNWDPKTLLGLIILASAILTIGGCCALAKCYKARTQPAPANANDVALLEAQP